MVENGDLGCMEVQLDRLVGPTHHFGGLGVGNLASQSHRGQVSNPAAAALQGLDKMRLVASLGVPQLVLPPQSRPHFDFLRSLGFRGTDAETICSAREQASDLLSASMSCSAMWTANAATVTPAIDSVSGRTCLTVANLNASLHRAESLLLGFGQSQCLRQLLDLLNRQLLGSRGFFVAKGGQHLIDLRFS